MLLVAVVMAVDVVVMILPKPTSMHVVDCCHWPRPLVVVETLHVVVGVGWWWCWCSLLLVHVSAGEREGWRTFVETSVSNKINKKIYPNTKKNISKRKGKERKKNLRPNDGEPSFGLFRLLKLGYYLAGPLPATLSLLKLNPYRGRHSCRSLHCSGW